MFADKSPIWCTHVIPICNAFTTAIISTIGVSTNMMTTGITNQIAIFYTFDKTLRSIECRLAMKCSRCVTKLIRIRITHNCTIRSIMIWSTFKRTIIIANKVIVCYTPFTAIGSTIIGSTHMLTVRVACRIPVWYAFFRTRWTVIMRAASYTQQELYPAKKYIHMYIEKKRINKPPILTVENFNFCFLFLFFAFWS